MKITLTSEESVKVEAASGPLTIEAPSADRSYSPFHMLGSSLAMCTFSVLQSYASHKNLNVDDLSIDVSWSFAENPHRVGAMKAKVNWPSLPAEMWQRAIRVANLCGVHNTLTHPPEISLDAVGAASPSIESVPANLETAAVSQADGQPRAGTVASR
jgi:uncharacterized OsmC-like protein